MSRYIYIYLTSKKYKMIYNLKRRKGAVVQLTEKYQPSLCDCYVLKRIVVERLLYIKTNNLDDQTLKIEVKLCKTIRVLRKNLSGFYRHGKCLLIVEKSFLSRVKFQLPYIFFGSTLKKNLHHLHSNMSSGLELYRISQSYVAEFRGI